MEQYSRVVGMWQWYKIVSTADLDKYLDSFRILFAFHSGKIECIPEVPVPCFEQQNQKLCYEVLKEKNRKKGTSQH